MCIFVCCIPKVESLGEEGLHQAGEKIASAVKSQRLPPSEVLNSIPVADADLISYRNFKSYNYTTKEQPRKALIVLIPNFEIENQSMF